MSGKRYAEEFKIEVVRQVIDRGYKINDVASPRAFFELFKLTVYFTVR